MSVALANETAVFGAAGSKARGAESGAAYLFERQDGRWAQITRLTADDGAPGQMFGFAVAEIDYVKPLDRDRGWLWQFSFRPGF